ncbi:MAG: hypothetical protein ABIM89_17685 [Mycobacteriales bacterium]
MAGVATIVVIGLGGLANDLASGQTGAGAAIGRALQGAPLFLAFAGGIGAVVGAGFGLVLGASIGIVALIAVPHRVPVVARLLGLIAGLVYPALSALAGDLVWAAATLVFAPLFVWACHEHGVRVAQRRDWVCDSERAMMTMPVAYPQP